MANLIFRGDAVPVTQVVHITPSNPEVGDSFTLKINGKEVTFVATDNLVSTVVDGLANAWNAAPFGEATQIAANGVDADEDGKNDYLELTARNAGVPFRVETSAADAGGFSVEVTTLQNGAPDVNEIQEVSLPATASGGTFALTFSGQTTAAIAYDAPATGVGSVQEALESLSNIDVGDVAVTGDAGGPWAVEFQGSYAAINVPLMSGNGSLLTGSASISVETSQEGAAATNEIQYIHSSGRSYHITISSNVVTIHDGEFGVAVYATEQATIDTLVQHAGLVQMGTVTIGSLTKHGGELIAENATLAGALKLHA